LFPWDTVEAPFQENFPDPILGPKALKKEIVVSVEVE